MLECTVLQDGGSRDEKALGKLVAPWMTKQGKIRSNTKEWSMQKQKMIIEI